MPHHNMEAIDTPKQKVEVTQTAEGIQIFIPGERATLTFSEAFAVGFKITDQANNREFVREHLERARERIGA